MPGLWAREVTLGQIIVHVICIVHSYIYIVHGPSLEVYLLMGYAPGTFNVPVGLAAWARR